MISLSGLDAKLALGRARVVRWAPFIIVALIGVIGAIAAFRIAAETDDARVRATMELRAEWRVRDFERKLIILANPVQAIVVLIASEEATDPDLFHRFATRAHTPGDPLRRIVWAPRTLRQAPDAGVARPSGNRSVATAGGEYYPAEIEQTFTEATPLNTVDLAGEPMRRSVIERARDEAGPLSTPPLSLFNSSVIGYAVFWPIYREGAAPRTVEERRARLRGVVEGTFGLEAALNAAIEGTPPIIETISFFVGQRSPSTQPVATYSPGRSVTLGGKPLTTIANKAIRITRRFDVFGQEWTLVFDFDRSVLAPVRSAGIWIFPTGMLLVTTLLLAYLAREQGYRREVESRVAERTTELSVANSSLNREIEERRRSERAARASEEQLNQAQQLAHMGYIHINLQTMETDWSDETYRICSMSRETFVPSMDNYLPMVHPDDRATVRGMQEQVRQGINPKPMEYRIVRPDGSVRRIYRESELVRDEAGVPRRLVSTIHDITERRQTEEQLRQAQKMEAIGNLTGGMAHDFNNLLGIIIGNLDLLRDRQTGDPDADELTGEALDAALRGADLTRRLLAFARRQPLQPTRTEVNALIAGIVKLLERTLGEQIKISLDLDTDTWPVVIDPVQLESSLANLANNARDAMPRGGELIFVTGNRSLDADYASLHAEVQPGDYAMIEVSDTGTGMPPEVASHIFEPFYSTKEQGKGTGLGLSMVFGFMKQSGGHINVYSEVGIGTTFRLYLPRADSNAASDRPAAAAVVQRGNGETVLAVEDNASLRRVVVRQLTELGYRVIEADDAQTAFQVLESEKVDLLFTDIVMPGGTSGYEIAGAVLSRWPAIKVVLTSGFPEIKINSDTNAPNLRLLSKPYRRDDLGRLIREVLDS